MFAVPLCSLLLSACLSSVLTWEGKFFSLKNVAEKLNSLDDMNKSGQNLSNLRIRSRRDRITAEFHSSL